MLPRNENSKRKYESPTWNFTFLALLNLGKMIGFGVDVVWIQIINWSNDISVTLNTVLLCNPVFSSSCWSQKVAVRIKWNMYVKTSTTGVFLKDFWCYPFDCSASSPWPVSYLISFLGEPSLNVLPKLGGRVGP